ncbi:S9 family peptidase [Gillisia marina]|uniref:S9 family peptidase n=1 Tax=Gillisia marina TaxID=1167637 RepID=UPI00029A16A5|nr:prolyl oligopeptidase family serine peptidase [Gillisia marina]
MRIFQISSSQINTLIFLFIFSLIPISGIAQSSELSVEKIMQDPSWMGTFPSNIQWSEDSKTIYFNYNLQKDPSDSLYKIQLSQQASIVKVSFQEQQQKISSRGDYNKDRTKKVFTRDGNLMLFSAKEKSAKTLLELGASISNPNFQDNEDLISFEMEDNLYLYDLKNGSLKKLTSIKKGEDKSKDEKDASEKEKWLEEDNLGLLAVVLERKQKADSSDAYQNKIKKEAFTFYTGKKSATNLQLSRNAKYATFNLITRADNKRTIVPNYVDESGYTVDLNARSKVGDDIMKVELAIYNFARDTVYLVKSDDLPGIKDLPDYTSDYPDKEWEETARDVIAWGANFSDNGKKAIVNVRSHDNKDRWISLLDFENGTLKNLDRQRDEAWIGGPGVGYSFGGGTLGWLPDNIHIYFQSEETGYSHLYLLNTENGKKTALTSGTFEVFDPQLSKDGKNWFLTTSKIDAGERHFYKMPVMGGKMAQLTELSGNNQVTLSPDEKQMAILYSSSNQPWELYLKRTGSNTKAVQLTKGQSKAFDTYNWRIPSRIKVKAEDGAMVPARLYQPKEDVKNGAAIIFVHGAGYLQNAHNWWSSYFREYMFHNLLTDLGYTVLDMDYRGSAGYGRDWRTAIYRHMGGKDLSDQVDGAKFLVEEHGIDQDNIGIYGGSYGGFITLMAMFNESDTFKSGAALRSVTDWAHYNDGYTSNILNTPVEDPIAYKRSSPIYFAEGLKGNLLIAHGMVDTNVHYQDVVRLAQRLIELEKDNWEMAVYPVEGHGFVEPSSWTDEYKRILKLFNETLLEE